MVAEGQSPLGQERCGNRLGRMMAGTRICSHCHPHTEVERELKKSRKWNTTLKTQAHLDTSPLTPLTSKTFHNFPKQPANWGPSVQTHAQHSKFTGPQTRLVMSKGKMSLFSPISKHSSLSVLHCPKVSKYLLRLSAVSKLEYTAMKSKSELCTSSIQWHGIYIIILKRRSEACFYRQNLMLLTLWAGRISLESKWCGVWLGSTVSGGVKQGGMRLHAPV